MPPIRTTAATGREPAQLKLDMEFQVGERVRVAGRRGSYRVVGIREGGAVQVVDDEQKWHVFRPDSLRAEPATRSRRLARPS